MTDVTSPRGEIRPDAEGGRTLVFHRLFPYPIEDVWSELTDSDRLVRWFGSYQGLGVAGGTVALTMTAEEDAGGEPSTVHIVDCESPCRLVVDVPEGETRSWRIALTLSEDAGTTTLLFEQAMPSEMDSTDVGPGWHWYLDRLTASLAGTSMPDWDDYYPALKSAYS
ncbi:MAG: SRPBCC domain-containing protein [Pseudonocardiales bacterium]